MDERFEQLAKLVGEALARRWMQYLAQKNSPKTATEQKPPSDALSHSRRSRPSRHGQSGCDRPHG